MAALGTQWAWKFLSAFQPSPASKFIQGYLGAVISAVSIAVSNSVPTSVSCSSGQTCLKSGPGEGVGDRGLCGWATRAGFLGREESRFC